MFKPWLKPEAETKLFPISLDGMIQWLGSHAADEEYEWVNPRECLMEKFGKYHGFPINRFSAYLEIGDALCANGFDAFDIEVKVAAVCPHTFGAALDRALALKAGAAQ